MGREHVFAAGSAAPFSIARDQGLTIGRKSSIGGQKSVNRIDGARRSKATIFLSETMTAGMVCAKMLCWDLPIDGQLGGGRHIAVRRLAHGPIR